ncbi:hypothetical protein HYH03_017866 [Edaphochlamys debaryana]|uniref:SRCR domain-containing protein n=1 Tax=Edaphochlamys debaryana TaxID=47281 RepID=A0A836BQ59_9CHLO|nr:hypothetical protein HYH03_017866 [Edaphochlamys debaryana]|eukprot:KAG2483268.1 hypothetical protein HYH03_017866 [Edaphochlamys debaryana]
METYDNNAYQIHSGPVVHRGDRYTSAATKPTLAIEGLQGPARPRALAPPPATALLETPSAPGRIRIISRLEPPADAHGRTAWNDCSRARTPAPSDNETPSLITAPIAENSLRLVGGSSRWEGRVEIYVNGSWWGVCNHRWTGTEAAVVCRQLGSTGVGAAPASFGPAPPGLPMLLDGVDCSRLFHGGYVQQTLERLEECYYWENYGVTTCDASNPAGVRCSGPDPATQPGWLTRMPDAPFSATRAPGVEEAPSPPLWPLMQTPEQPSMPMLRQLPDTPSQPPLGPGEEEAPSPPLWPVVQAAEAPAVAVAEGAVATPPSAQPLVAEAQPGALGPELIPAGAGEVTPSSSPEEAEALPVLMPQSASLALITEDPNVAVAAAAAATNTPPLSPPVMAGVQPEGSLPVLVPAASGTPAPSAPSPVEAGELPATDPSGLLPGAVLPAACNGFGAHLRLLRQRWSSIRRDVTGGPFGGFRRRLQEEAIRDEEPLASEEGPILPEEGPTTPLPETGQLIEKTWLGHVGLARTNLSHGTLLLTGGPKANRSGVVQLSWCGFLGSVSMSGIQHLEVTESDPVPRRGPPVIEADLLEIMLYGARHFMPVNALRAAAICMRLGFKYGRAKLGSKRYGYGRGLVLDLAPVCSRGTAQQAKTLVDMNTRLPGTLGFVPEGACRGFDVRVSLVLNHTRDLSVECYDEPSELAPDVCEPQPGDPPPGAVRLMSFSAARGWARAPNTSEGAAGFVQPCYYTDLATARCLAPAAATPPPSPAPPAPPLAPSPPAPPPEGGAGWPIEGEPMLVPACLLCVMVEFSVTSGPEGFNVPHDACDRVADAATQLLSPAGASNMSLIAMLRAHCPYAQLPESGLEDPGLIGPLKCVGPLEPSPNTNSQMRSRACGGMLRPEALDALVVANQVYCDSIRGMPDVLQVFAVQAGLRTYGVPTFDEDYDYQFQRYSQVQVYFEQTCVPMMYDNLQTVFLPSNNLARAVQSSPPPQAPGVDADLYDFSYEPPSADEAPAVSYRSPPAPLAMGRGNPDAPPALLPPPDRPADPGEAAGLPRAPSLPYTPPFAQEAVPPSYPGAYSPSYPAAYPPSYPPAYPPRSG